ncbi:MAG: MFS transporter [Comamonadaceae bacterium]|nr:MAG: MFS transporter [Comamonadaceae bacterium]
MDHTSSTSQSKTEPEPDGANIVTHTKESVSRTEVGQGRRAALGSLAGTVIEFYDFFIYGTAAVLVFGPQFFPNSSSAVGTLAAFSTYAVAFVARPLGAFVMGHFGDRIGRRSMLLASLFLMGIATVCIGLLPTYAQIGIVAPILLVLLRFAQGFGAGGEWGGAVLMSMEHAPKRKRVLYGSMAQLAVPIGITLATSAFLLTGWLFTQTQFDSWAWRLPFLASAALIIVGLLIRLKVEESPDFKALEESKHATVSTAPLAEVVRNHWRNIVAGAMVSIAASACAIIILVFCLFYATTELDVARSTMLWITILSSAVWLAAVYFSAMAGDRFGTKQAFYVGAAFTVAWAFPLFWIMNTGSNVAIFVAMAGAAAGIGFMAGPQGTFIAEAFPVRVRYSGASVAYSLGGLCGGAFAPLIATAIFTATGSTVYVSVYVAAMGAISFAGAILLRKHPETPLAAGPTAPSGGDEQVAGIARTTSEV